MNYLSISRLTPMAYAILLMAGMAACNGPGAGTVAGDTARHAVVDTVWIKETDSTPNHDWDVYYSQSTKFQPAKTVRLPDRDFQLDGEVFLIWRNGDKRPFTIRTRQLIITLQSPTARLHIDAFAASPGEQADLLEGEVKVTKSYHSSTDDEPEILHSGDMVMINRDIDLMEKETLDSAERRAVEKKFALAVRNTSDN
jgi:hypothetical protein